MDGRPEQREETRITGALLFRAVSSRSSVGTRESVRRSFVREAFGLVGQPPEVAFDPYRQYESRRPATTADLDAQELRHKLVAEAARAAARQLRLPYGEEDGRLYLPGPSGSWGVRGSSYEVCASDVGFALYRVTGTEDFFVAYFRRLSDLMAFVHADQSFCRVCDPTDVDDFRSERDREARRDIVGMYVHITDQDVDALTSECAECGEPFLPLPPPGAAHGRIEGAHGTLFLEGSGGEEVPIAAFDTDEDDLVNLFGDLWDPEEMGERNSFRLHGDSPEAIELRAQRKEREHARQEQLRQNPPKWLRALR